MTNSTVESEKQSPLEIIFHRAKEIEVGGQKITFNKVRYRDIKPVLTMMRKVISELEFKDGKPSVDIKDPVWILDFVERHVDDVSSLLTMLTSAKEDDINNMEIDDVVVVAVMAFMENRNFFYERVLPLFRRQGSSYGSDSQKN